MEQENDKEESRNTSDVGMGKALKDLQCPKAKTGGEAESAGKLTGEGTGTERNSASLRGVLPNLNLTRDSAFPAGG